MVPINLPAANESEGHAGSEYPQCSEHSGRNHEGARVADLLIQITDIDAERRSDAHRYDINASRRAVNSRVPRAKPGTELREGQDQRHRADQSVWQEPAPDIAVARPR